MELASNNKGNKSNGHLIATGLVQRELRGSSKCSKTYRETYTLAFSCSSKRAQSVAKRTDATRARKRAKVRIRVRVNMKVKVRLGN